MNGINTGIEKKRKAYDIIAQFYRGRIIKRALTYFIKKHFKQGSEILHAGCGSGEVDTDIKDYIKITALDISDKALIIYKQINGENCKTINCCILDLTFEDSKFDGIYNLGVMEHFEEDQVIEILKGFNRILKEREE